MVQISIFETFHSESLSNKKIDDKIFGEIKKLFKPKRKSTGYLLAAGKYP